MRMSMPGSHLPSRQQRHVAGTWLLAAQPLQVLVAEHEPLTPWLCYWHGRPWASPPRQLRPAGTDCHTSDTAAGVGSSCETAPIGTHRGWDWRNCSCTTESWRGSWTQWFPIHCPARQSAHSAAPRTLPTNIAYIINFYFLCYISFYVACAIVIYLINYLLTYDNRRK